MKRVWMLSALALSASSPSMAQDTCTQAALAYYCTAVTTAIGQTAGGDLGGALLSQSAEYGKRAEELGHSSLKSVYYRKGVDAVAKATDRSEMEELIKLCVSKNADAVDEFLKKTENTCEKPGDDSRSSARDSESSASSEAPKQSRSR